MKQHFSIFIVLSAVCFQVTASEIHPEKGTFEKQYRCVADAMQAIDSHIYYNLTSSQIDSMLQIPELVGHVEAVQAVAKCSAESKSTNNSCNGNLEALFVAQYNHVHLIYAEAGANDQTTFDLKNFRFYDKNIMCPLDIEMAKQAVITENRLLESAHGGVDIFGTLVYNPRTLQFFINY